MMAPWEDIENKTLVEIEKRLRDERKAKSYPQERPANLADLPTKMLFAAENGHKTMRLEIILVINEEDAAVIVFIYKECAAEEKGARSIANLLKTDRD